MASTTGDGSDDTCINNVPFEVSLSKASGPYSYGGSTQDNCLGCGHAANSYVVSSTSYKVTAEFSSVPQGNWYSWGNVNYLSYELFSSATPSSHSGQRFTNENNIWTSTGPDRVNMYDDAYSPDNFYYCCGAYKEAKAGSAGTTWTAADGTSLIVSNKAGNNVCCTQDQCVGNDGACINEGVVNPGHGYSGTDWICGTTGSGPFDYPLFMKCDSSKVGVQKSGNVCCCSGATCAFQAGSSCGGGPQMRIGPSLGGGAPDGTDFTTYVTQTASASCTGVCTDTACCNLGSGGSSCKTGGQFWSSGGTELICSPETGASRAADDRPAIFLCNEDSAWQSGGPAPNGQFLASATTYCCHATPSCNYQFDTGSCNTVCSTPSDCTCGGSSVYLGQDQGGDPQGWTWDVPRELTNTNPIHEVRDSPPSCDTSASGNQCTPHEFWDGAPYVCYDGGDLGAWDAAATQWICGDDSAGLPAWFQCNPDFANEIFPGTGLCCKDLGGGSWRFTSDTTGCSGTCTPGPSPPENTVTECSNGDDDDCDGDFDCDDSGCFGSSACASCGNGVVEAGEQCDDGAGPNGPCPAACSNSCTWNSCVVCDVDGDGQNGAAVPRNNPAGPGSCSARTDCRDAVGQTTIKSNQSEDPAGAANYCTDGFDNDCEASREADYDGGYANNAVQMNEGLVKGDSNCTVGVAVTNGIVISPSTVNTAAACSSNITITCTASVGSIRSIEVSGPTLCSWTSWAGRTASYTCIRPQGEGSHSYSCLVNTSESYAVTNATHVPSVFASVTVDCNRTVTGTVTDAITGGGIAGASVLRVGGGAPVLTDSVGSYSLGETVPLGTNDFLANRSGYYPSRRTGVVVSGDTDVDFSLSPEQCTAQCTLGSTCDYACIGQNGCVLPTDLDGDGNADSAAVIALFRATCQGAAHGSQRDFNATHIANCCLGLIAPKGRYETPLSIESCASQLVPHQTIVSYNGKPHLLTVMSYRTCD